MDQPIKIIIAEDHQIVLDGLLSILHSTQEIEIIATAKNGLDVLEALNHTEADIVLMDLNMPGLNGIETTKKVHSDFPNTKVLILTMHSNLHYLKNLYKLGVAGYLLKDVSKQELVEAIRTVKAGGTYFDQRVTGKILSEMSKQTTKLTSRKLEVLELLYEGLSTKELSQKLFISINTVETHRKHLLEKLNVTSTPKLLSQARELGFI